VEKGNEGNIYAMDKINQYMSTHIQEIICLALMTLSPVLSGILLFIHLKDKNHATKKKRNATQKVLHRKPRRNQTVNEITTEQ